MLKNKLKIGILGGMGPAATADLYQKIILCTPAKRDQDHLHILINNNPQIPDRNTALHGKGPDPLPLMLESARELENAKVDFIVIPCNTAHAFVPRLAQNLKTPILSMVQVCVEYAIKQYPGIKKVGLLATCGTILSNIYNEEFAKKGITVVIPEEKLQKQNVMQAIFGQEGIKAGNTSATPHRLLVEAAHHLEEKGAQIILMACTEIPLVLRSKDTQAPLLDFTTLLAQATVKKALGTE